MKSIKLIIYLITACSLSVLAQSSDTLYSYRIDSIIIKGNDITEEDVILRELTFLIGDSVDTETLKYNRERIYSLALFNHVNVFIDSLDKNILWIVVEESWYIYPLPYTELKDRDWSKISYGADLLIKNFRGRNETLQGRITFGYDPSYYLFYHNPYLLKEDNVFFSSAVSYRNSRNRSIKAKQIYGDDFDQKFISGEISAGKRLNVFNRVSLSLYYVYVDLPIDLPGFSASGQRIDRIPGIGFGYSYDTRDLSQFPSNGILGIISMQYKGMGVNGANYQVYNIDFREYRQFLKNFTAKWRFAARFTSGLTVPFYDYSFLGLGERIRGHFNEKYEGHNSYLTSIELFYPIIRELKVNLDFIPIIPDELLHYRFALYTQIFGDAGGVQNRGESFGIKDVHSGYGIGLTFLILPYNIMRLEYAFDEYKNGEFIFDLGISF